MLLGPVPTNGLRHSHHLNLSYELSEPLALVCLLVVCVLTPTFLFTKKKLSCQVTSALFRCFFMQPRECSFLKVLDLLFKRYF